MKRPLYKHIVFIALSLAMMVLLPWLISWAVPAAAHFPVVVLLLLVIYPLFMAGLGIAAGWNGVKHFYYVPVLGAVLHGLGTGLFLTAWNISAFFYVLAYLLVGSAAMGVTHLIRYYLMKKADR